MKKVINGLIFCFGIFCLYAACRGIFLHQDWLFGFLVFGFALGLLGSTLPNIIYRKSFWDFFSHHPWTRISYLVGSIGLAIACLYLLLEYWGINGYSIIGGIGFIFFLLGAFVIRYYDYSECKERYIKN